MVEKQLTERQARGDPSAVDAERLPQRGASAGPIVEPEERDTELVPGIRIVRAALENLGPAASLRA
jgi:hypothetical protein